MSSTSGVPPLPLPGPQNWTYSGDPSSSAKDALRFSLGDTDPRRPLLTDGELLYLLNVNNLSVPDAAVQACEAAIAKLSRNRAESVGSVSIQFQQELDGFIKLLALLRRRQGVGALPYAGGISVTDKMTQRANSDRVGPSFTRDMMQDPDNAEQLLGVDGDDDSDSDDVGQAPTGAVPGN